MSNSIHSKEQVPLDQLAPTGAESEVALNASRLLTKMLGPKLGETTMKEGEIYRIQISHDDETEVVALPASVLRLMTNILTQMGQGKGVAIVPAAAEMTTQDAADMLNVSRPYFVKLLDEGKIPYRKVGVRRRVLLEDVMQYKQQSEAKRKRILAELVAQAQELDMGY